MCGLHTITIAASGLAALLAAAALGPAGQLVEVARRLAGRERARHMGNDSNSEADWYPLARTLAREGYMVLTYNRRGVCSTAKRKYECSGGIDDYGTSWQDVVGAERYVRARGAQRVAVAGANIGGTSSMYAAATGRIHPTALITLAGVNGP